MGPETGPEAGDSLEVDVIRMSVDAGGRVLTVAFGLESVLEPGPESGPESEPGLAAEGPSRGEGVTLLLAWSTDHCD